MNKCTRNDPMTAQRYCDGELAAADVVAFEAHLPVCATCREAVDACTTLGDSLRNAFAVDVPAGLVAQLQQRAREQQLQGSRRIAWGLLAAASVMLVSSLFLVGYSRQDDGEEPVIMAQWEEYVVTSPSVDEEYIDLESRTLVAIYIQKNSASENGNE